MTAEYVLKMVCTECMAAYDVELIHPVVTADGAVHGMAGSAADFCDSCESPDVECLGVSERAS